jgi:hypothetical protein
LQPFVAELGNDELIAESRGCFLARGREYARSKNSNAAEIPSCVIKGDELVVGQARSVHEGTRREQGLPVPPCKIRHPDVGIMRSHSISAEVPPNSKSRQLVDNHIQSVFGAHVGLLHE